MVTKSTSKQQRLYAMTNPLNLIKIGVSINPLQRKRQLELTSGLSITILKAWETLDLPARQVEQQLHREFGRKRLNGEWFKGVTLSDIEFAGFELRQCNHDGTIMAQHKYGDGQCT